jgi:hypothetical protein
MRSIYRRWSRMQQSAADKCLIVKTEGVGTSMRKLLESFIVSLLLLVVSIANAQRDRFISLRSTVHFNFALKAPSQDDAGIGLQIDMSMFARKKLTLLLSVHGDRFIGDKLLAISNVGRVNKGSAIYGVEAGPEYFINRHVAIGVSYGLYWHSFQTVGFSSNDGYRFGFTIFPGRQKSFVMQLARTDISRQMVNIRYYSLGLGYRFM